MENEDRLTLRLERDDIEAVKRLVKYEPTLTAWAKHKEAWGLVASGVKTAAMWITAVFGAMYWFREPLLRLIGG